MPIITLPDGSKREFANAVTGEELAASIGAGLAKAALCVRVDGELKDIYLPIEHDAKVQIITAKDADGLELIRHDTEHILAEAVKELFPEKQVTIGPDIDNGFYYDFSRHTPFSRNDLEAIEKSKREIVAGGEPIRREEWDRDEAVKFFKSIGYDYKAEIIGAIPA